MNYIPTRCKINNSLRNERLKSYNRNFLLDFFKKYNYD